MWDVLYLIGVLFTDVPSFLHNKRGAWNDVGLHLQSSRWRSSSGEAQTYGVCSFLNIEYKCVWKGKTNRFRDIELKNYANDLYRFSFIIKDHGAMLSGG